MVIQEIELENFKSFLTRQKLPLAPITLLYGPNGGGKSSVIQALLAVRQSLRQRQGDFVADGSEVSLGGFKNVVSRHDVSKDVCVSIKRPPDAQAKAWGSTKCELRYGYGPTSPKRAIVTAMVASWEGRTAGSVLATIDPCEHVSRLHALDPVCESTLEALGVQALDGEALYRIVGSLSPLLELSAIDEQTGVRWCTGRLLERFVEDARLGQHFLRLDEYGMPALIFDSKNGPWVYDSHHVLSAAPKYDPHRNPPKDGVMHVYFNAMARIWRQSALQFREALHGLVHIEPLRQQPQRVYRYGGLSIPVPTSPFADPEHWADILKGLAYDEALSECMRQFDIPYRLQVHDVPAVGEADLYQLMLEDLKTGSTVTLADVGFGVSQLLPIIAHGIRPSGERIIAVQQPELHLHPRLQANLADFLIDFRCHSLAGVDSESTGRILSWKSQWIVETHSEALITRLQRRIREGRISASVVSVLYLDKLDDIGTVVTRLHLDDNGNFLNEWPGGFFEDGFDDVFGGLS